MGVRFLMQKIKRKSRQIINFSRKGIDQKIRRIRPLCLAVVIVCSAFFSPLAEAQALGNSLSRGCDDVKIIFARGSGERLSGNSETAWKKAIDAKLRLSSLKYSFYELGSESWGNHKYPAMAVGGNLQGGLNLVGAYIGSGKAFVYGASVNEGIAELKAYTDKISKTCPETKFVLGGYSQGGQVISSSLTKLNADKIIYAATFGDPKLYLPEGKGIIPPACLGKNYSNYRKYVPNCWVYEGILNGTKPYQTPGYLNKLGVWCNKDDIMCSKSFSTSAHTAYVSSGLYEAAAKVIVEKLDQVFPETHIHAWWSPSGRLQNDVAFLIDTTGSMKKLMAKYSTEAKSLAKDVLVRGGRIALFEYQDLRDHFNPRMLCDFGCTFEDFSEKLDNLTTGDGGDTKESALSAMKYAMNSLNWQTGATKSLILLTDANYHNPDRDGTLIDDVVSLSLEIDPVNCYIITEPQVMSKYQSLAERTGGRVFNVNDEDSLILSSSLVLNRPSVSLPLAEYAGMVNEGFSFEATAFDKDGNSEGLIFDWDLDGNGEFEFTDAGSSITHSYSDAFAGFIQVRVTDQNDLSSTMSAYVEVYETMPKPALISNLQATPIEDGQTNLKFETDAENVLLILNDTPYGILERGRHNFKLTETPYEPLEVTLVPYDQKGRQGIPASIKISEINKTPNNNQSSDKKEPTKHPDSIPLAPNSGVMSP